MAELSARKRSSRTRPHTAHSSGSKDSFAEWARLKDSWIGWIYNLYGASPRLTFLMLLDVLRASKVSAGFCDPADSAFPALLIRLSTLARSRLELDCWAITCPSRFTSSTASNRLPADRNRAATSPMSL